MNGPFSMRAAVSIILVGAGATTAAKSSRRDVFVRFGAPAGGNGAREKPYSSIQEMVDNHEADWGQVFLYPGLYKENVDIHRGRFWFFPARQYGVVLEGSITVRRPGTIIRGITIRGAGTGITLAEGARNCQIQHCRFVRIGAGAAGIEIAGKGISGCLIGGNVIDLRDEESAGRSGIRLAVSAGVSGNRLDHNVIAGCETGIAVVGSGGYRDETNVLTMNRCTGNAVGLVVGAPGITAAQNRFEDNRVAGVRVDKGFTTLERNRLMGNGVGIIATGGNLKLHSNIIADSMGAALRVEGGQAELLHNTFHAGKGTGDSLLYVAPQAEVAARYNIFSGSIRDFIPHAKTAFRDNLLSTPTDRTPPPSGFVLGDPRFIDPRRGDFHLAAGSPAIGAAGETKVARDVDGAERPRGGGACLGAHESTVRSTPRELYVAAGAADGDGSAQRPYGQVALALTRASAGDTILLLPGVYNEPLTIRRSGAPGAPIAIRSRVKHQAILRECGWTLSDCSYVQLEGLSFEEPPGAAISLGPYVRHSRFVDNRIVRSAQGGGAILVSGPGSSRNLFEGNVIKLNRGGVGLQIACQRWNRHITIRRNDISGCYYGIQTGGGSYPTAPPGYHLIEDNELHHNWKDGLHSKTTDNVILRNHIHHNDSTGLTTRYGSRNVIVGNRVHDNKAHGMRLHSKSHFVIDNVIYGNGMSGIYLGSWPGGKNGWFPHNFEPYYEPPHEVWIAHNTLYGNGDWPVFADSGSQVMLLRNILVGTDGAKPAIHLGPGGILRQAENNLYWQARMPLLREYEGGAHDRYADPGFIDPAAGDFRLAEDSPARAVYPLGDALSFILSMNATASALPDHLGAGTPRHVHDHARRGTKTE